MSNTTARTARVERTTRESSITVELNLDGTGITDIATGVPFYDHMLTAFGQHGSFDLTVAARGDIEIEAHHTVEDTAIVLGQAFARALGDKKGIRRFGDAWIPMDETLAHAAVDVSGRPYFVHTGEPEHLLTAIIPGADGVDGAGAPYSTVINRHVFESLALNARIALHVLETLERTGGKRGMAAICIGGGLGGAMMVERIARGMRATRSHRSTPRPRRGRHCATGGSSARPTGSRRSCSTGRARAPTRCRPRCSRS